MIKKNNLSKTLVGFCLIAFCAGFLLTTEGNVGAGQTEETDLASAQDAGVKNTSSLDGLKEKRSYAMGMIVGHQFRNRSVDVDLGLYVRGIQDALANGQTLMTETEAINVVRALQKEIKAKQIAQPVASDLNDIKVSFKLDPRLTRSMYMGDRWISKTTFLSTIQEGSEHTVEVRAQGLDAEGRPVPIDPQWISEDSDMVSVTPGQGKGVKITVKRAGQGLLRVVSGKVEKKLHIKGIEKNNGMQVEISQ